MGSSFTVSAVAADCAPAAEGAAAGTGAMGLLALRMLFRSGPSLAVAMAEGEAVGSSRNEKLAGVRVGEEEREGELLRLVDGKDGWMRSAGRRGSSPMFVSACSENIPGECAGRSAAARAALFFDPGLKCDDDAGCDEGREVEVRCSETAARYMARRAW